MPVNDIASRLLPYAEEALENEYARDNLREGATKLRDAYKRTRKKRVDTATDGKLRDQLVAAVAAFGEGTQALAAGRQKPKRRTGRRLLLVGAIVVAAAAAAVALNDDLRTKFLGGRETSQTSRPPTPIPPVQGGAVPGS